MQGQRRNTRQSKNSRATMSYIINAIAPGLTSSLNSSLNSCRSSPFAVSMGRFGPKYTRQGCSRRQAVCHLQATRSATDKPLLRHCIVQQLETSISNQNLPLTLWCNQAWLDAGRSSCMVFTIFSSLSFDVTNRAEPCVHVVLRTQKLPTDAGIMPHDESSS